MFLQKLGNEEQQEKLLREWLDCCVTEGGVLVAMQKSSRRRNHPLVTQMVEKWLDRYRQIRPCTSLSDGEEDEDDEDEWNKHLRRKKDQGIRSEMAPKLVWYLKPNMQHGASHTLPDLLPSYLSVPHSLERTEWICMRRWRTLVELQFVKKGKKKTLILLQNFFLSNCKSVYECKRMWLCTRKSAPASSCYQDHFPSMGTHKKHIADKPLRYSH